MDKTSSNDANDQNITFEEALDKTGFGLYNYLSTLLSGLVIIASACVVYGGTIIAPASACELGTTGAQQGLIVAIPTIGTILAGPVWGYLGDTRGRRNMLMLSLLSSAAVNALASLSVHWVMLVVLQFVATMLSTGKYTLAMTLLSECVPMARRNLVVLLVSSIFMLSQGVMAALAIPIIPLTFSYHLPALGIYWNSWRTLLVVYSLPCIISAICLIFMQESPKFVLMKGDDKRALEILTTIHRVNNGKKAVFQVPTILPETKNDVSTNAKTQIAPLFKAPHLKYIMILSTLYLFQLTGSFGAWLPMVANLVIRLYQTGEVRSMTLCSILNSGIELPVDPDTAPCALNVESLLVVLTVAVAQSLINAALTLLVVDRFGRRNTAISVISVVGLSGLLVNAAPNMIATSLLFIVFQMGLIVIGMYTAITMALFPTHLRALAVAVTMTIGRLKGFASIQIINYLLFTDCELGFYLFSAIFMSSAVIAIFLPDDRTLKNADDVIKPNLELDSKQTEVNRL